MIMYPARVIKEDAGFSLVFIDFPNAFTQGETMEELKENAIDILSMALKHLLDAGREFPQPNQERGDDILMVEPSPEIRQRMGHKKGCECPVCRNARGERGRTKVKVGIMIDCALWRKVEAKARTEGKKKIEIIEAALRNVV